MRQKQGRQAWHGPCLRLHSMDAHSDDHTLAPSLPLELLGVKRGVWDGERPWGLVWCCSDLRQLPETVFGTQPGELLVLQGSATVPAAAILSDVAWAARQHELSHVFVVAHAGCRMLRAALGSSGSTGPLAAQLDRLGLFAGCESDEVGRMLARVASEQLRVELARRGARSEVLATFADERGRLARLRDARSEHIGVA